MASTSTAKNSLMDWQRELQQNITTVSELEKFLGVRIRFRAESQYTQEQYDVVLL